MYSGGDDGGVVVSPMKWPCVLINFCIQSYIHSFIDVCSVEASWCSYVSLGDCDD